MACGGWNLEHLRPDLQADRELVLAAVGHVGHVVRHRAQLHSKEGRELVLAAVAQDGMALQLVPPQLQVDLEVVLAAWVQNEAALEFAPPLTRAELNLRVAAGIAHCPFP